MTAKKTDLPDRVIFEVTGSRSLLGEQQRTQRFGQTAALAGQSELLARETDWQEVTRQLWEDSKQKDPERFLRASDRNEEIQVAVQEVTQQFQAQMQEVQQQVVQLQEQTQQATDEARKQAGEAERQKLRADRVQLEKEQEQVKNTTLSEQLKLTERFERAEDALQKMQRDLDKREAALACKTNEPQQTGLDPETAAILKSLVGENTE